MIDPEEILKTILNKINIIDEADIPAIDLYMDQVTTFMDKQLAGSKRRSEDKILTKTMINNYSKNDLLPPPEKKRYSKQHVILLIFIYYYKNILSINDINTLLTPVCEKYFADNPVCSLDRIYKEVCDIENGMLNDLTADLHAKIAASKEHFSDLSEKDSDFLQLYFLITSLCFDVYFKKQMIEGIIDRMNFENEFYGSKVKKDSKEKKEGKEKKDVKDKNDL